MVSRASKNVKFLITGISGFVGGHYLEYLSGNFPDAEVTGVDHRESDFGFLDRRFKNRVRFHKISMTDDVRLETIIRKSKPDYIVHLASFSSVSHSWKDPASCFVNNTNIFLNLAEAVRRSGIKPRILSVGSSEEYGTVRNSALPLKEESALRPVSPYAVARVSQEMLSVIYAKRYGIPIICTRSFNHIGPRQRDVFVVSSFARQIAEAGKDKHKKIKCGDLGIIRDFIDVRDAVAAYNLLLSKGGVGEVYNVCSGNGHKLSEILRMMQDIAHTSIPVKRDPLLTRPADNPVIIGSCEKLRRQTGFKPGYSIKRSLEDILAYWGSV